MLMRVQAGQQRGAAWAAQRMDDKRIFKDHAFIGEAIEIRALKKRLPGNAQGIAAQIVNHNDQDVRQSRGHPGLAFRQRDRTTRQ